MESRICRSASLAEAICHSPRTVRVCIVYDCLFPHTVGGAERWYRNLATHLAAAGHEITYLTMRQWERGVDPGFDGVTVVPVAPRMRLYAGGRRRILPPLAFGLGVTKHLLRHGARYDVVHTCSFPYFALLGAGLARRLHGFRLVVDWFEVWSADYWREYLGRLGVVGNAVQRLCARVPQRAFCSSRLYEQRLRSIGLAGPVELLPGLWEGSSSGPAPAPEVPSAVFAGRHIPEKRAPALVPALALARRELPELRGEILGDGPERALVLELLARHELDGVVVAPGFVDPEVVDSTFARASCMVLPSRREGYGMVVVEAAARGVPSVVVAGPDNAAVELVEDGVNGYVARSAEPAELAGAIVRAVRGGDPLRRSTAEWFARNRERLSLQGSLAAVAASYAAAGPASARS
jgi:glycosyltransferase involved in cell wall biosynthesis